MTEDLFWQIIESFDWTYEGFEMNVMQPAVDMLSRMTIDDLKQFDEILAQKLYALDTKAHAEPTGFGKEYFSVDKFLYRRCCVVVNGRKVYERVLNHEIPIQKGFEFEFLLSLTYFAALEMGIEDYEHFPELSYETFSNEDGWKEVDFPDGLPPGHKPKHQRSDIS